MPSFEQLEFFERWLQIAGYEGLYEVSDWGRVRSLARATTAGRLLVPCLRPDGYLCVTLSNNGRRKSFLIHRFVAEAFLGPCPIGKEADHIDGNRTNATLVNLRYVTPRENSIAAHKRLGWAAKKIPLHRIQEIRRLQLEGMTQRRIAKLFNVTPGAISYALRKHFVSGKEG